MSESISTEQMRTNYRRDRELYGWKGEYLEGERIYLTASRRNMKEVERTMETAEKHAERGTKSTSPV